MLIGEKKIERPLRRGMIGGGRTAEVGPKHRRGSLYDNTAFKLVCGAFDVDPERNIEFGVKSIGCFIERPYKLHRLLYD